MKKRNWLVYVVIILIVLVVVAFDPLEISLYVSRRQSNHQSSISTVGTRNYLATDFSKNIGIFFEDLGHDRRLKEIMAGYLLSYLKESGEGRVVLLQSKDYAGDPLDMIINVEFSASVSMVPIVREGWIKYSFETDILRKGPEDYTNEEFKISYSGYDREQFTGIISRKSAYRKLMREAARGFVEQFNKELNKRYQMNRPEEFKGTNVRPEKVKGLANSYDRGLKRKYANWIPNFAEELNIYYETRYGNRVLISYTAVQPLKEILDFYSRQVEENLNINLDMENWAGGKKKFHYRTDEGSISISIRYSSPYQELGQQEKEVPVKTVKVMIWDFSP